MSLFFSEESGLYSDLDSTSAKKFMLQILTLDGLCIYNVTVCTSVHVINLHALPHLQLAL